MPGRKRPGYLRRCRIRTPPARYPRLVPPTLDAALLTGWVKAAVRALERHRAEMDRINVFPVPDGDTGTNLLLTMRSAAESLRRRRSDDRDGPDDRENPEAHAAAVAATLARGALLGARGNSGVILSQVLRGVAEAVAAVGALGVAAVGAAAVAGVRERVVPAGGTVLTDALGRAARLATAAVSRPREGTVLSVLASAAAAARAAPSDRLDEVAVAAAEAAAGAVQATTGQLPELARAGVVDAGGLGVWLVLDALAGLVSGRAGDPVPAALTGAPASDLGTGQPVGSEFEVMYLLDAAADADVDALRSALALAGSSVAVAEDGTGTWTVHVHTADVGAVLEAGISAGRPRRITVAPLPTRECAAVLEHGSAPTSGTARFAHRHAVLLLVPGPELAELARSAGASVLVTEPDRAVAVETLVAALARTRAREVVLLPGDRDLTAVAERAAAAARHAGQEVLVIPTGSVLQGLAALAVHDPARRPADDVVAMAEAAAGTRTAALTVADAEALTWVGRCQPGDVLGQVNGEIVLIAADLAEGALALAQRLLVGGGELLTVLLGAAAGAELADGLVAELNGTHPEIDVIVHRGGPAGHVLELGVE
jgi:DAK2 domain fusion protein YloV